MIVQKILEVFPYYAWLELFYSVVQETTKWNNIGWIQSLMDWTIRLPMPSFQDLLIVIPRTLPSATPLPLVHLFLVFFITCSGWELFLSLFHTQLFPRHCGVLLVASFIVPFCTCKCLLCYVCIFLNHFLHLILPSFALILCL